MIFLVNLLRILHSVFCKYSAPASPEYFPIEKSETSENENVEIEMETVEEEGEEDISVSPKVFLFSSKLINWV